MKIYEWESNKIEIDPLTSERTWIPPNQSVEKIYPHIEP